VASGNIEAEPAEDEADADAGGEVAAKQTATRRGRCATCYSAAGGAKAGRLLTKVGKKNTGIGNLRNIPHKMHCYNSTVTLPILSIFELE
jgi:hypothetical protein